MSLECRLSLRAYAPGEVQAVHEHDHVQVSVVLRGNVMETVGAAAVHGTALSVVTKSAGVVHADTFGPFGATLLQLAFPLDGLESLVDAPTRAAPWRWIHDPRVARPFICLLQGMKASSTRLPVDHPACSDILAAITARAASRAGAPPPWLRRVHEHLEHDWSPSDSVASLAADAGVHPVYLARSMRRWYGHSVAEHIRRSRSRAAARTIATSADTLSRVAHGAGYADEAHLCREFRHTVGLTPGRYRRLLSHLPT